MEENEIECTVPETPCTETEPPVSAPQDTKTLEKLADELAGLRREWEEFLAGTAVRPDRTPNPGGGDPAPACTAAGLRGMTADEINARWNEIRRELAGGRM